MSRFPALSTANAMRVLSKDHRAFDGLVPELKKRISLSPAPVVSRQMRRLNVTTGFTHTCGAQESSARIRPLPRGRSITLALGIRLLLLIGLPPLLATA